MFILIKKNNNNNFMLAIKINTVINERTAMRQMQIEEV